MLQSLCMPSVAAGQQRVFMCFQGLAGRRAILYNHFPVEEAIKKHLVAIRSTGTFINYVAAYNIMRVTIERMAPTLLLSKDKGGAGFHLSRKWGNTFLHCQGFSHRRITSVAQKVPADAEDQILEMNKRIAILVCGCL